MSTPPPGSWPGQPEPGQQGPGPYPPGAYPPPGAPTGPAPLNRPQYDATIGQAVSRFWRKFAVFSGRASRSEYWWWALVSAGVSLVLQLIGNLAIGGGYAIRMDGPTFDPSRFWLPLVPSLVWSVIVLLPSIAVGVRRLHDTNRSGRWYLLIVPGYLGLVLYLIGITGLDYSALVAGDLGSLLNGPLVAGVILTLIGFVGSIVVLIFFILAPDPRGSRFDGPR